jgi:Acetyltransferase (GNAT) domain
MLCYPFRRRLIILSPDRLSLQHVRCHKCRKQVSDLVFRDVESIAQTTYQRGLGVAFQDTPEMRGPLGIGRFQGLAARLHSLRRWKALRLLERHGVQRTLCGDHIGYDPTYSRYSPGMYLSLTVIGDLCDHRQDHDIALVDFGIGDAEYKSILSNYRFQECAVHVYGRTLRGLGINLQLRFCWLTAWRESF